MRAQATAARPFGICRDAGSAPPFCFLVHPPTPLSACPAVCLSVSSFVGQPDRPSVCPSPSLLPRTPRTPAPRSLKVPHPILPSQPRPTPTSPFDRNPPLKLAARLTLQFLSRPKEHCPTESHPERDPVLARDAHGELPGDDEPLQRERAPRGAGVRPEHPREAQERVVRVGDSL